MIDHSSLTSDEIEILTWSRDLLARVKETKGYPLYHALNTARNALNDVIEMQPAAQAVS